MRERADAHEKLIQRLLIHVGNLEGLLTAKGHKDFTPFDMGVLVDTSIHKSLPDGAKK